MIITRMTYNYSYELVRSYVRYTRLPRAVLFYSNPNALLQLLSNDALIDAFTPDVLLPP